MGWKFAKGWLVRAKTQGANLKGRYSTLLNAYIKDVLIETHHVSWTEEDQELKNEIFSYVNKKCVYCLGDKDSPNGDHFIPTNCSKVDPKIYGAEHDCNILRCCRKCNANKSNHHPIAWLKRGRTGASPIKFQSKVIDACELFLELFKDKLIANETTTEIINNELGARLDIAINFLSDIDALCSTNEPTNDLTNYI